MKIKGKLISNYVGKMYEFTLPDGTRKCITVNSKQGITEARELLMTGLKSTINEDNME